MLLSSPAVETHLSEKMDQKTHEHVSAFQKD